MEDDDIEIVNVISRPSLQLPKQEMAQLPGGSKDMDNEKPLLNLIKLLVNFMNNEKTVLTNSQLMTILYKEFDVDIYKLHSLEAEIYMSILKKFLKSWPKWDMIDLYVQKAKLDKTINIESILFNEYESLKKYLKEMLDLSKKPTQEIMEKLKQHNAKVKISKDAGKDNTTKEKEGILEISCQRKQLGTLFYSHPHPELNNTIFHLRTKDNPSKISVTSSSFDEIFNWPLLNFNMDIGFFDYSRKNYSKFKHTLVNLTLGSLPTPPPVNRNVLSKAKYKTFKKEKQIASHMTAIFLDHMVMGIQRLKKKPEARNFQKQLDIAVNLIMLMKKDLTHAPEYLDKSMEYMYALNPHSYVRYLTTPLDEEVLKKHSVNTKLNLALQEYMVPSVIFNVAVNYFTNYENKKGKITFQMDDKVFKKFLDENTSWLKVECGMCETKFSGASSVDNVKQHFEENHVDEADWSCSKCRKTFTMKYLAAHNWYHRC